jgi:hypothetical protein
MNMYIGDWVTEKSLALAPSTSKAFSRLAVEDAWLGLRNNGCQGSSDVNKIENVNFKNGYDSKGGKIYPHVFRLGGIYGPVYIYLYMYIIYIYMYIYMY